DAAFWQTRLHEALQLRRLAGYSVEADDHSAARLVFSEADGLSGLIVDRYADVLVVQVTAVAVGQMLETVLLPALQQAVGFRRLIVRTEHDVQVAEGANSNAWDTLDQGGVGVVIEEHGLKYAIDLQAAQKTGLYLDQRENRVAAARYLAGRQVLDVCSY